MSGHRPFSELSDQINVRRLLLEIQSALASAHDELMVEEHRIYAKLYFDQLKTSGLIVDYKFNDAYTEVGVQMVKAVEFIHFDLTKVSASPDDYFGPTMNDCA